VSLANIEDVVGALVPENLLKAKQRRVYGRVFGHIPTNIDQIVDGYPATGTVSVTVNSAIVTGSGTLFLKELSPDDKLVINAVEVTIATVDADTSLTLSEVFSGGTNTALAFTILPEFPKPFINRVHKAAGHATRQPETTVTNATSLNFFEVGSTLDMRAGDKIFVGAPSTGELVTIQRISSNFIKTEENLLNAPTVGKAVKRASIQNVRINNTLLRFDRDFTYDATIGVITLKELAEFNVAPIRELNGTLTFTTSSRTVTGSATTFNTQLQPGMFVRSKGEAAFFYVQQLRL